MKFGIRCSEGGHSFEEALSEVTLAESVGFDSAWIAEHHGWDDFWPSPHVALAGLATATTQIKLGTCVLILPQANPVRLAGEISLLDVVSGGRVTLGVGVGWRGQEMENLGFPFRSRGERMTEHLNALLAVWEDDPASFDGSHVSFENFSLQPKPLQDPHPPIWVGGEADVALKRAAVLGDAWLPVWRLNIDQLLERNQVYRSYLDEFGRATAGREQPILRLLCIDEDTETARESLRNQLEALVSRYQQRGYEVPDYLHRAVSGHFDEVADGRFIYGDPERCIATIDEISGTVGSNHFIFKLYNPGVEHEQVMEQIELVGEEVIPQFR